MTNEINLIMIGDNKNKGREKEEYIGNADREDCSPAERQSEKVQMEGSFGAGDLKREVLLSRVSRKVPLSAKRCRVILQKRWYRGNSPFVYKVVYRGFFVFVFRR